jgi:nucleoid DNA-binding protein
MPAKKKPAKSAARKKTVKKAVRKPAAKKTAAKKVAKTAKKAAPRKVKAVAPVLKAAPAVKSAYTRTELTKTLSDMTGLSSKEIKSVMEALEGVIQEHMKARGPQVFALAGLMKLKVIRKPATKARKGINPFTGEPTVFKAKPARNVVKVLALKKLKEMAK